MEGDELSSEEIAFLLSKYLDRDSSSFLELNHSRLFRDVKNDANLAPASYEKVKLFQQSLEYYSKSKERYQLKGKKRHSQFRRYQTYSPGSILAGDLAFLNHLTPMTQNGSKTVLVIIDLFSRFCGLRLQRSNSSKHTLASFEAMIGNFTQRDRYSNYRYFLCDRGYLENPDAY